MNKSTPSEELCDFLNLWDDLAAKAIIHYFENHDLPYLNNRMVDEYSADFGVCRPLRDVWVRLLDLDPLEFIEFYEGIYRFRKTPRYEDIIISVFISIASGFAANALYDEYKVWRGRKINEKVHEKFSKSGDVLFKYLTRVYAIREAYFHKKISYEKFIEIRDFLKRKIIIGRIKKSDEKLEKEFSNLWREFIRDHSLVPLDHPIEEIKYLIKLEYETKSTPRNRAKEKRSPANGIVLQGLAASTGVVYGMLKIISSAEDIDKTLKGDIGVFEYFTPDMVPCIKRCVGAIGLPDCGGLTGHLAIVSRELGIPCVTDCDYDRFSDYQIAYLDGDRGEIRIILSMEELKNEILGTHD